KLLNVTPAGGAYDFKFSPDGRTVSYVFGYNIYLWEVATGRTILLTTDGTEAARNATSDTLSELLNGSGHWWSPDSKRIAYLCTDESQVAAFPLVDMKGPDPQIHFQRYPVPGSASCTAAIRVIGPEGQVWINTSAWIGCYIANVSWLPDSRSLAIQLLNRQQNQLFLVLADAATGATVPLLAENDPHWINVCNDLFFFRKTQHFLWSAERGGYRRLYLCDRTRQLAQLSADNEAVLELVGVDEDAGTLFYLTSPAPWLDIHLKRVRFTLEGQDVTVKSIEDLTPTEGAHLC